MSPIRTHDLRCRAGLPRRCRLRVVGDGELGGRSIRSHTYVPGIGVVDIVVGIGRGPLRLCRHRLHNEQRREECRAHHYHQRMTRFSHRGFHTDLLRG